MRGVRWWVVLPSLVIFLFAVAWRDGLYILVDESGEIPIVYRVNRLTGGTAIIIGGTITYMDLPIGRALLRRTPQGSTPGAADPSSPVVPHRSTPDPDASLSPEEYLRRAAAAQERVRREDGAYTPRKGDLIGFGLTSTPAPITFEIVGATEQHFCMSAFATRDPGVVWYATERGVVRDPPGPRCDAPTE